jgi:hypothetical protein
MTREEFIEELKKGGYSYRIEGNKVAFSYEGSISLMSLTSLPPGVEFRNEAGVYLDSLTSLPPGVVFKNGGSVFLDSLTSLPPGVEFKNGGDVYLDSLIGGWFYYWEGNIEGIDSKRLLNKMISLGLFEKRR